MPNYIKICIILILFSLPAVAQISPGDLSNAHAHLEGMSNCTKCHTLGDQISNEKCLSCHSVIGSLISSGRGYHASSEVRGKKCYNCHSDHHGRNFHLINFNKAGFDHNRAGYKLTGKHSTLSCGSCHKSALIKNSAVKNKANTYLGLEKNCLSCHADFHQGSLGKNCESCHNTNGFKESVAFDHTKANFQLTGSHVNVACERCHPTETVNGKETQKFKGIAYQTCSNCHRDPHSGKFGPACESCHVTASFQRIANLDNFDHGKTNYPLTGRHKNVVCNTCHKGSLSSKPKHDKCIDCHTDYHNGDFVKNGVPSDCSECHSIQGFVPSSYTLEKHQSTVFPLAGSHLAVPCITCHKKEPAWKFNLFPPEESAPLACTKCHTDFHAGEITVQSSDGKCETCHTMNSWKPVTYDHSKTGYTLTGKHKTLYCNQCHSKSVNGENKLIFASLPSDCESCHPDKHAAQFAIDSKTECTRCHKAQTWKPVTIDHDSTRFPLTGSHSRVSCSKCHKPAEFPVGTSIQYKFKEIACAACHS